MADRVTATVQSKITGALAAAPALARAPPPAPAAPIPGPPVMAGACDVGRKTAQQAPNGRKVAAERRGKIVQRWRNRRGSVLNCVRAGRAGQGQRDTRQRGSDREAVTDPRALVRGGTWTLMERPASRPPCEESHGGRC